MSNTPLKLKIAYLYPDFLQGFCDKANLDVYRMRASERNISVDIEEIRNDDKISSAKYDFYYISGSNTDAIEPCYKRLRKHYSELIVEAQSGVPMLAINCGYVLFGKTFQLDNSPVYNSIGILDVESKTLQAPIEKKISGNCSLFESKVAGYINCIFETHISGKTKPFLTLQKELTEGAINNNVIGTHIISPILAQNPHFCDFLISKTLQIKYKCNIPLTKLTDDIEWYSHNYLLETK